MEKEVELYIDLIICFCFLEVTPVSENKYPLLRVVDLSNGLGSEGL